MPTWDDVSSYSRGDTDRTPNEWRYADADLRLWVHRHISYPGVWLLTAPPFAECRKLNSTDIEKAKEEAVAFVRDRLTKALAALEK